MLLLLVHAGERGTGLYNCLEYVRNGDKTEDGILVNSLNCTVEFAEQEFLYIQRKYHKENDDRVAYHVIQSFDIRDDITPEQANEIGMKLCKEIYPNYQCVVSTHIDKGHLHNHIVLNATSLSGRKLEDRLANKIEGLYGLREASDRISLEYGCHVMKDFKPIGKYRRKDYSGKLQETTIKKIYENATAKYLDQKKELDRKFKAQTASYDSFLLGLLLYGVLTTVFTAVRSEAFVSDFKTFFMVIWQFIVNAFQLLLKGGQWASQLGDKIPQPVVATIVHYLLLIVFVGGIAIGVGFLIFLGASKVFEFYTEDYADTMSLAVFLISLAVSVYFAEPIRAVIPINLLLLLILVHIVYVLIRWYVKGCKRSRGYY